MDEPRRLVIWSPEAVADLDGIWDYFEHTANYQTAEKVTRGIYHRCSVLADHIYAGHKKTEILPELYSLATPPFTIFYKITNTSIPEIVRVLNNRQDISKAFNK